MDGSSIIASTAAGTDESNNDTNTALNNDKTDTFPSTLLQSTSAVTEADFVTVDEIAESFKQKEDDSLSNDDNLSGSNDSITQLLGSLRNNQFDIFLNAPEGKKKQEMNSLKSEFGDSSAIINEDQMNSSSVSAISESGNPEYRLNIETSTPFRRSKPLAARFLKNWKPSSSFLNEELDDLDEIDIDVSDDETGYEEAMASLKEVLGDTSFDTASQLNSYSNVLDAFKKEGDKKYDKMISSIALENHSAEELEVPTKEVDEFNDKCPEKNPVLDLSSSLNDTVIQNDSKDSTLVARDELITVNDTETTIKDIPKIPVFSIDSSQSEIDNTIVPSETPIIPKTPVDPIKSDVPNNQKTNEIPKENDLEILIIEGDEDIDINADDEDLLLASDDEAKLDKSENKKVNPEVPLLKDLEVFVSHDPDENRDNNDPKWDYLRNLGTDYDRYLAVRSRWRNIQIPNPKKDLTCRCRNPVEQLNGYSANYNNNHISNNINNNGAPGKRLHSPENEYRFAKKPRRDTCTIVFDRSSNRLVEHVQYERQKILNEQEQALQQLADTQHMEKYLTKQGGSVIEMKRLENKHIFETRKCLDDYHRRIEDLLEMERSKLCALQEASKEVQQFHEFYPNEDEKNGDTKSLIYLTDTEVQEILEVEEMILSFRHFYDE